MKTPPVTPLELQGALADLAIASSTFTRGRGRDQARANLSREIVNTMKLVRAPIREVDTTDPDFLINQYLLAGGKWRDLVAAVSRHALEGAGRRSSS